MAKNEPMDLTEFDRLWDTAKESIKEWVTQGIPNTTQWTPSMMVDQNGDIKGVITQCEKISDTLKEMITLRSKDDKLVLGEKYVLTKVPMTQSRLNKDNTLAVVRHLCLELGYTEQRIQAEIARCYGDIDMTQNRYSRK